MSIGPICDSIEGPRSSQETPVKYDDFRRMLRIYLRASNAILQKNRAWANENYLYFDLNAGYGVNPDGSLGSPLLFRDVADEVCLPFRAWLFEGHAETAARLSWSVADDSRFTVIQGDHRQTVSEVAASLGMANAYGLIYADPNNGLLESSAPVISSLLAALPRNRVDVLWYGSGSNVKRVAGAHGHLRLVPQIEQITKKNWFLRAPRSKHQWTFGFGTDWKDAPEPGPRFGQIGTERGDQIALQLNDTNAERLEKVATPLPFPQPVREISPIEPTGTISVIRDSGRFALLRSNGQMEDASDAGTEQLKLII